MFEFLAVMIPSHQAAATYDGTFTVLGGANRSAQDNLGAGAFHLQVTSATTPEPGTLLLMGIGLLGLWLLIGVRKAA